MEFIDILIIVLLLIASVLGLYLIKLIKRLFITIDFVEKEIKELDSKITPLISEVEKIIETGNSVAEFVKEQTDYANGVAANIKNKFSSLTPKSFHSSSPQNNAKNMVTNIRALFKGVVTFINELK
jgi:uncharacterized protein YoxC